MVCSTNTEICLILQVLLPVGCFAPRRGRSHDIAFSGSRLEGLGTEAIAGASRVIEQLLSIARNDVAALRRSLRRARAQTSKCLSRHCTLLHDGDSEGAPPFPSRGTHSTFRQQHNLFYFAEG